MGFEKPGVAPERPLIYGTEKVGKSTCWWDWTVTLLKRGFDGTVFIMDTDKTYNKMADNLPGRDLVEKARKKDQVRLYQPFEMREALGYSKEIQADAKRHDLIVIDMLDWGWDEAQYLYIREVHGEDPDEYFLKMRRAVKEARERSDGKKGHKAEFGGQEGTDWTFITKVYKMWELPLTMRTHADVIGVTSEKQLDENRGATPEDLKKYRVASGRAPAGQKGIGHRFDSVMRMTKRSNGQRQLTMIGDRGREGIWAEKVGGRTLNIDDMPRAFAKRYLKDVAGWTVTR